MAISDLIDSINATAESPGELTGEEQVALKTACDKLKSKLESPRDAAIRILFSPVQSVALRLAIDMNLFDAAASLFESKQEVRIDDLAAKAGAEKLLVVRIVRFLVAMDIFEEIGEGVYKPTPLGSAFVSASPLSSAVVHFTAHFQEIHSLPDYFAEHGYKNPGDAFNGPFQYAQNTDLHLFDWLATRPRLQQAFNVVMRIGRTSGGRHWSESLPVESKLRVDSPEDTILVDVGGGVGHDLIAFRNLHPSSSLPGKLVVQDIPVVIDSITELPESSGIVAMKHDFFSPQPVRGARAYFLANVLHDWPDKQALTILRNIADAMASDSMVLINENLVPESGASLFSACSDMNMMAGFSSLERTEEQFRSLLDQAGLKLVHAWTPVDAAGAEGRKLLEAIRKP